MTPGERAWAGLAAYVIAYDAYAHLCRYDTMSEAYARALQDRRRWPTLLFWAYLVSHLTRALPPKADPLRKWL